MFFYCHDCFLCYMGLFMSFFSHFSVSHSSSFLIDFAAGNIRFHVAFSNGVSPVGGRYKAASVRTNKSDCSTWLTAKREGHQQPLDGQTILHDINTLVRIYFLFLAPTSSFH